MLIVSVNVDLRAVTCSRNSGVLPNSEFFRKQHRKQHRKFCAISKGTQWVAAHCTLNKQTCSTSSYAAGQQTQPKAEKISEINGVVSLPSQALFVFFRQDERISYSKCRHSVVWVLWPYSQSQTYKRAECCPEAGFILLKANKAPWELATLMSCLGSISCFSVPTVCVSTGVVTKMPHSVRTVSNFARPAVRPIGGL